MIIHNFEQKSEAWYQEKAGRVSGTRFKNLMSAPGTASYQDLVTNIACEMITGRMEETYSNADMEKGIETEPIAAMVYAGLMDIKVQQCGFITPDEDNPLFEWIGISPDRLVLDDGLLEIKCPRAKTHLEYIEGNKLPTEYRYQVQGQLFVTRLAYCDFMSFVEGMKPFIVRVLPDPELFKEFETRLYKLIEQVKDKLEIYHKYNFLD